MIGLYPITLESSSGLAVRIGTMLFYGKDLRLIEEYPYRIKSLRKQRIDQLIRRIIPDRYLIVIVGPASKIIGQLKAIKEISKIEVKNGGN